MPQTVRLITAGATQDLTTLAHVEAELGLTPGADAAVDATIALLITQASGKARSFCRRRSFARQTYIELIDGLGQQVLLLSENPVIASIASDGTVTPAIRSLTKLGSPVTDYELRDPEVGSLFRDLSWDLSAEMGSPFRDWPIPDSAVQPYAVTYDGGYLLPGEQQWSTHQGADQYDQIDAQPLPEIVERAAIVAVKDWWTRRLENGQRIKSKSVDDVRIEFDSPTAVGELPTPAAGLLHDFIRDAA